MIIISQCKSSKHSAREITNEVPTFYVNSCEQGDDYDPAQQDTLIALDEIEVTTPQCYYGYKNEYDNSDPPVMKKLRVPDPTIELDIDKISYFSYDSEEKTEEGHTFINSTCQIEEDELMPNANDIHNSFEPKSHPAELTWDPEEKREITETFYKGCTPGQTILQAGTKKPAFVPLLLIPPIAPEPNVYPLGGRIIAMNHEGVEMELQSFINFQGTYFPAGVDQSGYDRFGPRMTIPSGIHAYSEPPSTSQHRIELLDTDEGFEEVTENFFDASCPEVVQLV